MRRLSIDLATLSLLAVLALAALACAPEASAPPPTAEPTESDPASEVAETPPPSPQDLFWQHLTTLCGQAFEGALVSTDAVDADLAGQTMTMHVRQCSEEQILIPFHIGENRSRTWVLTRSEEGLQLQHDHRHEDGSEDVVTLYGGRTAEPGTEGAQHFPADDYSKELFTANGLEASVVNVWSLELEPGQRFSYILRRPERHFQADFDLQTAVPEPPAPWGH